MHDERSQIDEHNQANLGVVSGLGDDTERVVRQLLRDTIDDDGEWRKLDALATVLKERGCPMDRPYLSAMFAGVKGKPITLRVLVAFPPSILESFLARWLRLLGYIVIKPTVGPEAMTGFLSGLAGLFLHQRPHLAMAKATVPVPDRRKAAR